MKSTKKHGKTPVILLLGLSVALALSGCTSNADTLMSPDPTQGSTNMPGSNILDDARDMLPDMSPDASVSPNTDMSVASGSGLDTLDSIRRASDQMEDAIDLLSEIDDASVVAIGNQAIIGVEFEDQYQGELDDRIRKMILTRVQTVSKSVTEIYVTDDSGKREAIEALTDQLENATSLSAIAEAFNALTNDIPVYSE